MKIASLLIAASALKISCEPVFDKTPELPPEFREIDPHVDHPIVDKKLLSGTWLCVCMHKTVGHAVVCPEWVKEEAPAAVEPELKL